MCDVVSSYICDAVYQQQHLLIYIFFSHSSGGRAVSLETAFD